MSVELHLSDYFIESAFVGKDVAESLGYANASKAVSTHCKHVKKRNDSTFPKWEDGKNTNIIRYIKCLNFNGCPAWTQIFHRKLTIKED